MSRLEVSSLEVPPRLIVNPHAGHKLGMLTNAATLDAVEQALKEAGLNVLTVQTDRPKHATELARAAVQDGCKLVIAAGGDGTVAEAAEGLVNTDATLGIMPLGSIMNMARTLCIPRDLNEAARTIAAGRVLAMDVGRVHDQLFLEAGGVGLTAGLFAYFNRLDSGHERPRSQRCGAAESAGVLRRAAWCLLTARAVMQAPPSESRVRPRPCAAA